MASLLKIIKLIENVIPLHLSEKWDNSGLQVGNESLDVKRIGFALDPDEQVIDMAIKNGIDLVITHHPLLLSGIKKIKYSDHIGRIIIKALKNNIAIYSFHTNLDSIKGGLNDFFIEKTGYPVEYGETLSRVVPLIQNDIDGDSGIGRIIEFEKPILSSDLARLIRKKLKLSSVSIAGNANMMVKKVALCTGSGMSLVKTVQKCGIKLFITGDIKYHDAKNAVDSGMCLIDVGHFGSEIIVCDLLYEKIGKILVENSIETELILLKTENVFNLL